MIDWSRPLEAVDRRNGDVFAAVIAKDFARKDGGEFIRLSRNAWTGEPHGGTWFFRANGLAQGGIGPDGYEGRYILRNA